MGTMPKIHRLLTAILVALMGLTLLAAVGTSTAWAQGRHDPGMDRQTMPFSDDGVAALTADEIATLLHMVEEEKLARDVYLTLHAQWSLPVFANIARSEQQHMDAIQRLLIRYGIEDPTAARAAGEFADPGLQDLYADLIASGSRSAVAALQAGIDIETLDIADLEAAISATDHSDIARVYSRLLRGSGNHLRAFERTIRN